MMTSWQGNVSHIPGPLWRETFYDFFVVSVSRLFMFMFMFEQMLSCQWFDLPCDLIVMKYWKCHWNVEFTIIECACVLLIVV